MLSDSLDLAALGGFWGVLRAVVEITVLAYLAHHVIQAVRGTRAAGIFVGMAVLLGVYMAAGWLGLPTVRTALGAVAPFAGFALIVIFQEQIRAALLAIASQLLPFLRKANQQVNQYEDVVFAVRYLKANGVGALIVIERETGLKTFVESGLALDARLSSDLLVSIFLRRSPLHDGAVVIQGDRIAAAACFLPLTTNTGLVASLGTRHRAAIGLTEESDAVAIVVSEETGKVSVAFAGAIERGLSEKELRTSIIRHIGPGVSPPEEGPSKHQMSQPEEPATLNEEESSDRHVEGIGA